MGKSVHTQLADIMAETKTSDETPNWGSTTKLIIGMTFVALVAALLVRFRGIIGPLILAFVLTYLLYPVVSFIRRVSKLSWRTSVGVLFILLMIIYAGLITLTGFTVVQQLQNLVNFVALRINDIPELAADLSTQVFKIGVFEFNLEQFDLQTLSEQVLAVVQPLLGRMGGLISTFATSAMVGLGWSLFVILISYFLLADAGRVPDRLVSIEVPGYDYDVRRIGHELRKIWNAYLRGQLIIILLVMISYTILLLILGLRFAIGIAILVGIARFVPYIGPVTTNIVTFLVAFFQPSNYFGLEPIWYAILVLALAFIVDQIYDNLVGPRLLGDRLGLHPAAVLVAAIIAANLIGIIGLVLAAPVLATLNLLGRYVSRKMFDQDPWPEEESLARSVEMPVSRVSRMFRGWLESLRMRYKDKPED